MKRYRHIIYSLVLLIAVGIILSVTVSFPISLKPDTDLNAIKKRGYLTLVTTSNPTGYFIYKNTPMGFEYDLIKAFAESMQLQLKVIDVSHPANMYQKLLTGEADIMAYNIPVLNHHMQYAVFTDPYIKTELVLIQRKIDKKSPQYIDKVADLAGKTITISDKSPFIPILTDIQFELNKSLQLNTIDTSKTPEDLIRMVSKGEIKYTVANKEIALINTDYYDNIDISTTLTAPQDIAFTIHRKHRKLTHALNKFIDNSRKDQFLYSLYEKYFQVDRLLVEGAATGEATGTDSKSISIYDQLFQKYAQNINWDWRLIAAMTQQESNFQPNAKSWAGALGLMQLMPATAKLFGLSTTQEIYHPELNIKTGTKYIAWLENFWKDIKDDTERKKFIMASYNAGQGHVKDAQRLARKYGYNPDLWDGHVEYFLLNKSKPIFYMDPVCKHGYCRGSEPFNYVRSIIRKYTAYKTKYSSELSIDSDFSLEFTPEYELSFDDRGGGIEIIKQPLFNQNKIFQKNPIITSDSNIRQNGLKPRNPERIQLKKDAPKTNQLFKRNELFRKNQ